MSVWSVSIEGDHVQWGERRRKKLTAGGCNEPFKGSFWCPRRKWFRKEPCPFANRRECDNYQHMCGAL